MDINEKLRKMIAREINDSGLPLLQIATDSGVSYSKLRPWLRGENDTIRAADAGRIAVYLGLGDMKLAEFGDNGND